MYRKWTWTTTLECNKEEGENERGDGEREGESGGTVEVTENREINRQPIPPFTRRVSFIGSDNKKSVTEINWRTSRSIISELSSFLYRRGVVTRQRKRYTCAQRWGTNVAGISLYTYTLRDTIRIRESHVVRISRRSRMETRLSFSPTWNRDSVKMYFIRARSVELLDIGIRRIRISIVAYFLDAWRRFACFITTLDTCTLAVRISWNEIPLVNFDLRWARMEIQFSAFRLRAIPDEIIKIR